MTKYLQPIDAVALAEAAYDIKVNTKQAREDLADTLSGTVNLPDLTDGASPYLTGVSGGIFARKESGFGFCGYRARVNKEDLIISLRGTASFHDVLTDAYFKTSPSKGAHPVHGGFNRCFNSVCGDIDAFLKAHKPTAAVHCIGHSLGGALATLVADHIARSYGSDRVYLYTLGSPRVGTEKFSTEFTKQIKAENIFRLQHTADPVAAVPIWPFMHVPVKQSGILMDRFGFGFQASAHFGSQYRISVAGKSWESLRGEAAAIASSDRIERWLESKKPTSFTGKSMMMLSEAIYFVLKKTGLSYLLNAGVNTVATVGYTLLDMLAFALKKGQQLAKKLSKWVRYLVMKMMQMLGRNVRSSEEIFSQEYISGLLRDMHKRVNMEVTKALDGLKN